ncbi:MAG: glycosyltransferase family 2 protein [Nodosilinea sp. LVE1205-7]|jgi:N-acetylglucosaminyl-diphospho-decaprenol L-rhamnosyltransferase
MIYFVVVNYYSGDWVRVLTASIIAGINDDYHILIVNNSPEEEGLRPPDDQPITILEAGSNLGFGQACNLGISYVWQRHPQSLVWLINPDAVIHPDADIYIHNCFREDSTLAILGTQILTDDGRLWFSHGTFNPWTGSVRHHRQPLQLASQKLTCPSQWVTGCSLVINLGVFQDCPGFSDRYFLYCEDTDFCLRYGRQGYRVAVTQHPLVTHQVSALIGRHPNLMYQYYTYGRLTLLQHHGTVLGMTLYLLYSLLQGLLGLPLQTAQAWGRWQGIGQFLRRWIYPCKESF